MLLQKRQINVGNVGDCNLSNETEQRTMEAIQRAVGGVMFIDEAYSLKREDASGNDFVQVVIDTMVAAMTSGEYAGRFVAILELAIRDM